MSNIFSFGGGNGDIVSECENVTLLASEWDENNTYTISDARITPSSSQSFIPHKDITVEQLRALQMANIIDAGQDTGHAYLKAFGPKPTVNIPIVITYTPGLQLKEVENPIGNTNISDIGDGTLTGAVSALNNSLTLNTNLMGNTGISDIGDGTVTGAIGALNSNPVLLWTNQNPTAVMGTQTINIDLSEYEAIIVFYKGTQSPQFVKKNTSDKQLLNFSGLGDQASAFIGTRTVGVNNNSVSFGIGRYTYLRDGGSGSGTTGNGNAQCIPQKIYGVRSVLKYGE